MAKHNRHSNKNPPSRGKGLHPRNCHHAGYDYPALVISYPPLASYVKTNVHGKVSVDFANPQAVNALNTALLKYHYQIVDWGIPEGALCPPIPGRADYIHYIAELLGINEATASSSQLKPNITLLDIGTGANGIYPILACQIYGWRCIGSDIDKQSLDNIEAVIASNASLKDAFKVRLQEDRNHMFKGIIQTGDYFDITVCNPPFHSSLEQALKGSQRKAANLASNRGEQMKHPIEDKDLSSHTLNFGGFETELWCSGGERLFLKKMIKESREFSSQCGWFSSLISKSENVRPAAKLLTKLGATDIRKIEMAQGHKMSRILAWTYR